MSAFRARETGLSLLEFTLVVLIFAVLLVLAFERIAALRADVERAGVAHAVGTMRSALALEFARRISSGRDDGLAALDGTNALALLDPPPPGYVPGARYRDWDDAPPGTWFYDPGRGAVVYRATGTGSAPGAAASAAWRARLRGEDRDGDGRIEPGVEPVSGVALERLDRQ